MLINNFEGLVEDRDEVEVGVASGPCEDAPCCGCCGPHTGGYGDPFIDDSPGYDDIDAYYDNDPDYGW